MFRIEIEKLEHEIKNAILKFKNAKDELVYTSIKLHKKVLEFFENNFSELQMIKILIGVDRNKYKWELLK
jgi:hypothetical protein